MNNRTLSLMSATSAIIVWLCVVGLLSLVSITAGFTWHVSQLFGRSEDGPYTFWKLFFPDIFNSVFVSLPAALLGLVVDRRIREGKSLERSLIVLLSATVVVGIIQCGHDPLVAPLHYRRSLFFAIFVIAIVIFSVLLLLKGGRSQV